MGLARFATPIQQAIDLDVIAVKTKQVGVLHRAAHYLQCIESGGWKQNASSTLA
jgi:hypothetical protein